MYSYTRRGPGKGTAFLAVLQAILLLSALLLTPAAVIAQEADPDPSHTPTAEATAEPAAETPADPAPAEPKAEPKAQPKLILKPKPQPEAQPKVEKTLAEQGLTIRFFPQKVKVALGGKVIVGAYLCPKNDKTPFGGAKGSGDPTDYCDPVRVKWTATDGARLSNTFGKKTRLRLIDDDSVVRLTATVDDLKRPTRIIVKEKPAKVRPEGMTRQQLQQLKQQPVAETTTVAEPTAAPAEPTAAPAEPTEAPAEEPTEAPAEEPTTEPTAAPAEPTEAPAEEPSAAPAEPTEAPATRSLAPAAIEPAAAGESGVGGSANLDQCANGGVGKTPTGCDASADWVNGNLGKSKASYAEGETVPYRMLLDGLSTGGEIHALTIEWDTTKQGLHALDYITTFNKTETTANPCVSAPCSGSSDDTIAIPPDLQLAGHGVSPIPGSFHIWGGSFDSISEYSYSKGGGFAGDKTASITVYFTADQANPVISWGGHIASRIDWGIGEAAGTISGSPYHMRLISINDKGGNQDRSLAADAVYLLNRLTVIKDAHPSNTGTSFDFTASGDFTPTSFPLQHAGQQVFGPYKQDTSGVILELGETGWSLTDIVCGVQDANGGSQNVNVGLQSVGVSMKEGELVTCTFYNKQQKATLIVRKEVINDNGGSADAEDFAFNVAGPDPQGPIPFSQDGADPLLGRNTLTVTPGTYSVTENAPIVPGYAESYANCSNVVVQAGQTETCTITNTALAPTLQLVKVVDNGNTGAGSDADDWTLTATAASPDDARNISTAGGSHVAADVFANVEYTLGESGPAGYSASAWECTAGELAGDVLTLGLDQQAICTITNTAQPATLTLVKTVKNDDGGEATAADFQARIDGADVPWNAAQAVGVGALVVSETTLAGYSAGDWGGDCDANGNVTIALGDNLTCTITNDDDAPSLQLVKVVDNGNTGAGSDADDWTLTATAASPDDARNISTAGGSHVAADVFANVEYTLGESGPAGYSASAWECTAGELAGDVLTLGLDQQAICTITNTAQPATLTLVKTVKNDDGGEATAADFQARIDGADVPWNAAQAVGVGALVVSETTLAGYSAGDWGGDCDANGNVTIALGDNLTCTITNDDDAPSLQLVKVVDNGNTGAGSDADDWTLTATAASPDDARNISTAGGSHVAADVFANVEYTLGESGPAGYSASAWECTAGELAGDVLTLGLDQQAICTITNTAQPATLTLVKTVKNDDGGEATAADFQARIDGADVPWNAAQAVGVGALVVSETTLAGYSAGDWGGDCDANGNVTIALGDNLTCTITNDDDAPSLQLVKVVDNGNTGAGSDADDWTLTATAASPDDARNISTAGGSHVAADVFANVEYTLGESGPAGYSASAWECTAGELAGDVLTLGLDQQAICTITNTAQPATLTLVKTVKNDDGGEATAADFQARIDGADVPWNAAQAVGVGALVVSETTLAGYSAGDWGGDCDANGNVTIALGDNLTCTITNDDDAPSLQLVKVVDNGNTGAGSDADDWTLTATAASPDDARNISTAGGSHVAADVFANVEYTLGESGPAGYSASAWECTAGELAGDVLTLGLDQQAICTITNTAQPATITLNKVVQGGPAEIADFQAQLDGNDVDWGVAVPVAVGPHTASEVMNVDDYVAGDWTLDCAADGTVTVALGDQLECTISNFYAELSVEKSADPAFYAEVGDVISYTITATNTGLATLDGVDVTDEFPGGLDDFSCTLNGSGGAITLPYDGLLPGDAIECSATHTITEADIDAGSVFNQACADADQISDEVCDDATVELSELEIVKTADVDFYDEVGDVIDYTIIATNTGETVLTSVDLTDSIPAVEAAWSCKVNGAGADITFPLAELAAGETIECTASYAIVQADIDAGSVLNAACADSDQTNEVCDEVDTPLARLEIEKTASPDTYSAVGDEIVYTITATNTGEATLENVDISDALIDGLPSWTCQVGDTVVALPVDELLSGQSIDCTATYTIVEADLTGSKPQGTVTNTACAISDQTPEVCDEVTANEIVIELVKTVTPTVLAEPGGIFTYTLEIDNDSVVPVTITELTDDNSGLSTDWAAQCETLLGTVLAPDAAGPADEATCTYTVERTVAGVYPNIAQTAAVDANGRVARAQDDVTVTVLRSELEIVKTADVDFFAAIGDEIVYTVTATNTGEADLTNVDITDSLIADLPDWTCDPAVPTDLAAGASIECTGTYTIDQADIDAGSVTNAACVASDQTDEICDEVETPLAELEIVKEASHLSYAAVGDEIVYTITATNTGEADLENVDISDALIDGLDSWSCDPGNPVDLLLPGDTIVCEATYVITAADIEAGEVLNTACVDSDQTDEVCDEAVVDFIEIELTKTPSTAFVLNSGDEVTFTLEYTHTRPQPPIFLFALEDDVYGDLLDASNPDITDNTCAGNAGQLLLPDVVYTCEFSGPVEAAIGNDHVNVATITVTDGAVAPRFASASDDAVVSLTEVEPTPFPSPSPSPTLKPTDMLPTTDTIGPVDGGEPMGGLLNWAIWLTLSALLIFGTALIIRRERYAEVRNR